MLRRGAIKANTGADQGLNKFLTQTGSKGNDDADSKKNNLPPVGGSEDRRKGLEPKKEANLKNMYSFKIRLPDKEKNVYFNMEEVTNLAIDIGVDLEHDKSSHIWFLQQALLSDLPYGWTKEQNFSGKTVYHNELSNETTAHHPCAHKFRIAFNNFLKAENIKQGLSEEGISTMTSNEKAYMESQVNGLPQREKDALIKSIKLNVLKDEEKAIGNLTNQIVKCNFLFYFIGFREKKSKFGSQEKIPITNDGKSVLMFQTVMKDIEAHKNLSVVEYTLESEEEKKMAQEEATQWYKQMYPGERLTCPRPIENSEAYQFIEINDALEKALELRIDAEKEPYLLWVPRMAICVPLPPFWRKTRIDKKAYYYNVQYDVLLAAHPANEFMQGIIERIRESLAKDPNILGKRLYTFSFRRFVYAFL